MLFETSSRHTNVDWRTSKTLSIFACFIVFAVYRRLWKTASLITVTLALCCDSHSERSNISFQKSKMDGVSLTLSVFYWRVWDRVREGGEATRYFWIFGTVIRWLLLLLLILILIWMAAISPPQGGLTTVLSFVALVCHKHSPKQSSVWSQKSQEAHLFIVYIYKLLSI